MIIYTKLKLEVDNDKRKEVMTQVKRTQFTVAIKVYELVLSLLLLSQYRFVVRNYARFELPYFTFLRFTRYNYNPFALKSCVFVYRLGIR